MIRWRFQNKFLLLVGFIVYGFASLIAQLILLRELSVLFYGNELFIGFSLGAWLLWVGLGSLLGNKLQPRFFHSLFIILAPVLPLQIVIIRLAKLFFGFGMTPGPFAMMVTAAALLLPIGFVIGSIFSTGTSFSKKSGLLLPSHIYFLESTGAVLGGIAYTIFLSSRFSNFNIAIFLSALILITGAFFISALQKKPAIVFAASVFLTTLASLPFCDRLTHQAEWKGYELLAISDSRYENLALTKIGNLKQLFQNGLIATSFPDPQAHEEMAHWPLLAHPNPQNVLLIGGGEAGELREILKHPVRSVDYFELDGGLTTLLGPFLDSEDRNAIGDARVHIRHEDIRAAFRRELQSSVRTYDVIISNFPEPSNAQINRYFTQEFFKETKKHLTPEGIFALRIPSSENYLPPQISFFNQSIFRTLRSVFDEVSIIPGQSVILLAQNNRNKLDPQTLIERYAARGIKNIQVVPSYFPIKLDPSRVHFFHAQLTEGKLPAFNRDFSPVSYFYFWNAWLLKFQNQNYFLWLMVSMIFAVFLLKYLIRKGNLFSKMPEATTIFLLGFSGIVYEILVLLAFQAIHGYIYRQIGCLFASFMAGLAAGSGFALTAPQKQAPLKKSVYFFLCAGQAAYGIFLALILPCFETLPPQLSLPGLFNFLMVPAGIIPGFEFAYLARFTSGSKLYTADLWGSSLGAIITGLFLIPFLGFFNLLWLIAFLLLFAGFIFKFQRS